MRHSPHSAIMREAAACSRMKPKKAKSVLAWAVKMGGIIDVLSISVDSRPASHADDDASEASVMVAATGEA